MSRMNVKQFHLRRKSTLSRWGKGLGIRIPAEAARELRLRAGAEVSVEVADGRITIEPGRRKAWTESELLQGVTPQVVQSATDPDEVDWGEAVGKELW